MTRDPLNIGVRLTPELHAALSAEVSRRTSADPDAGWTLSSVARSILRVALLGRAAVPVAASAELRPVEAPSARAEVSSDPLESSPAEGPCATCGGGRWHTCVIRGCGRRTRTCACDASRIAGGACALCDATSGAHLNEEPPCATCGGGLWHHCTRGCGRRVRTCVCAESIALDGVCASCAQSPAPAVDLALAPSTGPRIAPDEVQDAARAEVLAWVAVDPKCHTRTSLAAVAGTKRANVLRWLAPGVRQRLPAARIDAILAHIRANP